MKKLFVSVPMKNRNQWDIQASMTKMKKIAEAFAGEEFELINSYIDDIPPENHNSAIWYLGKALEKLSAADVFIGLSDTQGWNGCRIENNVAHMYGLKCYAVETSLILAEHEKAAMPLAKSAVYDFNV